MGEPGFENPEDSIMKNTSRLFWTIKSQSQVTERIVISNTTHQKPKPFDCDLGGRNESCICSQR